MKNFTPLLFIFGLSIANADSKVVCKTTVARNPKVVAEYVIKDTLSKRLNSGVTFWKNGIPNQIDSASVAQFGHAKEAIYFLLDNAAEMPILRLYAPANKTIYTGRVEEFDALGKVSSSIGVNCAVTAI